MFECKYKFELEDSIISAKYVYKSQKRKQDKFVAILIPILIVAMLGMLIFDIVKHRSIVWDIILIVALLILEGMYLIIPAMLVSSQKKSYKKQKLAEMDYLHVVIDNSACHETMVQQGKEVAKNVHNLNLLTSYIEDANRLILVFNSVEYVCLRKDKITGDINKLKAHLEKCMAKSKRKK